MGWLYIIVRTFPFWAIPTAFVILTAYIRGKTRPKGLMAVFWLGLVVLLTGVSVFFLMFNGHQTAVPFVHDLLNDAQKDLQ